MEIRKFNKIFDNIFLEGLKDFLQNIDEKNFNFHNDLFSSLKIR